MLLKKLTYVVWKCLLHLSAINLIKYMQLAVNRMSTTEPAVLWL